MLREERKLLILACLLTAALLSGPPCATAPAAVRLRSQRRTSASQQQHVAGGQHTAGGSCSLRQYLKTVKQSRSKTLTRGVKRSHVNFFGSEGVLKAQTQPFPVLVSRAPFSASFPSERSCALLPARPLQLGYRRNSMVLSYIVDGLFNLQTALVHHDNMC